MKSSRFFIRDLVLGALLCMAAPGVLAGGPGAETASPPPMAGARASSRPAVDEVRERVIAFLSERVRRDPEDMVALNRLAGEYLGRYRQSGDDGDLLKSQAMAEQSLKSVPESENPGGLAARARARFALHHFDEAREMGLRLVAFEPDKQCRAKYEVGLK